MSIFENTDEFQNNLTCIVCQNNICRREYLLNLSLGNEIDFKCLFCLAIAECEEPVNLLFNLKRYILKRECLHKDWIKYETSAMCPKPTTCLVKECFNNE